MLVYLQFAKYDFVFIWLKVMSNIFGKGVLTSKNFNSVFVVVIVVAKSRREALWQLATAIQK